MVSREVMQAVRAWIRLPETWVLAALLAGRGVLSAVLGLGRDEAAYWYWAWNGLDASYSLLTAAAVRASTSLLGDTAVATRIPGLLAGAAAVVWLVVAGRRLGLGRRAALLAGVALAASPALSYSGSLVHPDAFLVLLTVVFAERAAAVARSGPGRGRLATAAGAAALAALAKLTGALLLAPAAWLVWRHRRSTTAAVPAGALIAGAGAAVALSLDPRVLEGVREFGRFAPDLSAAGRVSWMAGELLLWAGPALLGIGLAGAWALRRRAARAAWPAWAVAALTAGFFAAFAAAGQAKANWFLPALAVTLPLGIGAWEKAGKLAAARWLAAASIALAVTQGVALSLPLRPELWAAVCAADWAKSVAPTYEAHAGRRERAVSPTRTWRQRIEEYHDRPGADPRLAPVDPAGTVIVSNDYGLAFRVAHAHGRGTRVRLPWDPIFARLGAPAADGEEALYVSRTAAPPAGWTSHFREVRELLPADGSESDLRVWQCRDWRAAPRTDFITR